MGRRRWTVTVISSAVVAAAAHGALSLQLGAGPGHAHEDDDCGQDAQALLARFEAARAGVAGARLELDARAVAVRGEVNVGLAPDVDPAALAARHGLTLVRALPDMGLATLRGEGADPARLAAEPGVRFAEPNFAARTAGAPADPLHPLQPWTRADLEAAWELTTGAPDVLVAVLDTGCDATHPDLAGRVVSGWDFVNGDGAPDDDNGHGTAVTGIIVARHDDGGIAGVAPGARALSIKVADGQGVASVAHVAAGIDLALSRGARVINISLGTRLASRALDAAVERALAAGVVVVAAAGNDPVHTLVHPAAHPGVLSVTALGPGDALAFSSSLAAEVALGAPGEQVVTTYPGGTHGFISGSSAAAAFASGVAALALSRDPSLSGPQAARALRAAQAPLPALAGLEHVFRFGRLEARRAVEGSAGVALLQAEVVPRRPRPGQAARVRALLENGAHVTVVARVEAGAATTDVALAPGERRTVELPWHGEPALDVRVGDQARRVDVALAAGDEVDLRIVGRTLSPLEAGVGALSFTVMVENVGNVAARDVVLEARADGALLGEERVPALEVGARVARTFTLPVASRPASDLVELQATARAPGEVSPRDATAVLHAILDPAASLGELYQQSNGVDVILDAPWRIEPGVPYVPVLLFVPSKGARAYGSRTRLSVDRAVMVVRDDPASTAGTTIYEHVQGSPPLAPPGLVVVDELGAARAGPRALEPFGGEVLGDNGRHEVHRVPRAAFGVAPVPAPGTHRFLDLKVAWTYRVPLFFGLALARSGSHRAVVRVGFAAEPWARLPGDGHRHDVHNHTIAEWHFANVLNVFAPRKAYGGPLQMYREAAYAMGILPSAAGDLRDLLITTDHNNFYNMGMAAPASADHWPPFGEQDLRRHPPGTTKLDAYRAIFGGAAGEEVAFKQDVTTRVTATGTPFNVTLPLGAHLLLMNAEHVEGAWNGGGWIAGPGNVGPDVLLPDALAAAARQGRGAFAYAAHPFGGMGWDDAKVEASLGLLPQHRTRDHVDPVHRQFVVKGLQFWNGRPNRRLASHLIDFEDLNPWADPAFAAGSSGWDRGLQGALTRWHRMMATNLEYAFTSDPDTRFVRKVFIAAGSDAHGDFNFGVSRMATPVSVNASYHCANDPWFTPTTYCLGDGRAGATPGQRSLSAYAEGATVLTDGPLVRFTLDAEPRLDGADLRWHDATSAHEDDDGRIGGGGAFDGKGTALVRRGSPHASFRFRYTNSADFGSNDGAIVALKLYKSEVGSPNPTRQRGSTEQLVGRADFPLAGEDQDHVRPLDPAAEGTFAAPAVLSMGVFTGVDPDVADLGPDEHRAYTNGVWVLPFDARATVAAVDTARGVIPAGSLEVELTFDVTMDPSGTVELKPLDARGESTGRATAALMTLQGTWADRPGVKSSTLRLVNPDPVPLSGDAYPAPDRCSFVVLFRDPRDAWGNALHPIAFTFDAPRARPSGAPTPRVPGATGTTAAPITPLSGGRTGRAGGGGGGGGGGGCALRTGAEPIGPGAVFTLALLLLVTAVARRTRDAGGRPGTWRHDAPGAPARSTGQDKRSAPCAFQTGRLRRVTFHVTGHQLSDLES